LTRIARLADGDIRAVNRNLSELFPILFGAVMLVWR
jgi:hypothetical protein